jgi:hypothetical protein
VFASSAFAGTAFFKYERTSGMNKICYYDHLGSEVAITNDSLVQTAAHLNIAASVVGVANPGNV